jgi:biopolymer transport protein ExbD
LSFSLISIYFSDWVARITLCFCPVDAFILFTASIANYIANIQDATIKLHTDKTVPVQYVVTVIDAVNKINASTGQKHKVILATQSEK